MSHNPLVSTIIAALEEVKGVDIATLDVSALTDVTDYMIICTGTSTRHVRSLANNVVEKAREQGKRAIGVEGEDDAEWVLVDLGDVIVHLMLQQTRDFYQLEMLWKKQVALDNMRLNLIAIGQKMPAFINAGIADYSKRFPAESRLQLIEIPAEKRTPTSDISSIKRLETQLCFAKCKPGDAIIQLDERGKLLTTKELAQWLDRFQHEYSTLNFLIGGPDGFDQEIKQTKQLTWSLSPLTLPHPIARLVVVEQLYRALMLLKNHPYHRE